MKIHLLIALLFSFCTLNAMQTTALSELKTAAASTLPQLAQEPTLLPITTRLLADIGNGFVAGVVYSELIRYVQQKNKQPQNISPYKRDLALVIVGSMLVTDRAMFLLGPTKTNFNLCLLLLGAGCTLFAASNIGKKLARGL